jgi:hypothetical protein
VHRVKAQPNVSPVTFPLIEVYRQINHANVVQEFMKRYRRLNAIALIGVVLAATVILINVLRVAIHKER